MLESFIHLAYLGPGGPEFMLVMLVLIVLFGAKDAPRILRKLNEIINKVRYTADDFKREVMYSDLNAEPSSYEAADVEEHNEEYDYGDDSSYDEDESTEEVPENTDEASVAEPEVIVSEEDDDRKD